MATQILDLGEVTISPSEPQPAGSITTIKLTYRTGHPMDDTGCLKIAFRYASDFGTPQFHDPAAPNYCSIHTTADCSLEPRWDPKGHTRPWGKCLFLKVMRGFVDRDDAITIVFGDTTGGSPGWQLPTFCEESFEFKTLVDPIATVQFKELPSPTLAIFPGKPARALCIAPSQVECGQTFTWHLKIEDRWGNPTSPPAAFEHAGFAVPGIEQITGEDPRTGLSAVSNPIRIVDTTPSAGLFWADMHGQSEETIGSNTIADYFRFARDVGLLDIAAHQGNDFQITDAFWTTINETTRQFYEPGHFVTFPGYEWSGNTPLGGDRNVYYENEGGPIFRSCFDLLPGQESAFPQASTADDLFEHLRQVQTPTPFGYAHVGGRYADIRRGHDEEIELAVEVHSAWGTFEWMIEDAFRLGYRVAIVANSDGHKGRPGASYPGASRFGSLGGLTCILADKLDRASVLAALRQRRCYATTGHRPLLQVDLETADGQQARLGDIIESSADEARLHIDTVGTGPIESIEIRNGLETVDIYRPQASAGSSSTLKIIWSGAEVRGRARKVEWDGALELADNSIKSLQAINFWNPDQQPVWRNPQRVDWQSITTGGLSGLLLTLDKPAAGTLCCTTSQGDVRIAIAEIGLDPKRRSCGGLGKQIDIYRLPDSLPDRLDIDIRVPLRAGDNPLYVKVNQADGHAAWSSPIYVVRPN